MNEYRYVIDDESFELSSEWDAENASYIAEDAAEDFYQNHDGHSSEWPKYFSIYERDISNNWVIISNFNVYIDNSPTFCAT